MLFVQARSRKGADGKPTKPDKDLPTLKPAEELSFSGSTALAGAAGDVQHGQHGCLRLHRVPAALYRAAHKRVFFEPRPGTLRLFEKFNSPVKQLVAEWWERIETSQKFADNLTDLRAYHASLKPGGVTLVGLIAEGGQGMRTANNARFLGYLQGTPPAEEIERRREEWTRGWLADAEIKPVFLALLGKGGGDTARPTKDAAAWEACVEPLKAKFSQTKLGFTKSDLYRTVLPDLVAKPADFEFAWQQRKAELLKHWRTDANLKDFWETDLPLDLSKQKLQKLRKQVQVSDEDFCDLCQELQRWIEKESAARRKVGRETISRKAIGLRSAENYTDPADAPRIATIYNGLSGRGQFVSFRKGDPEGNRWVDNEKLFIHWSHDNAVWLFENSGRREPNMPVIRNPHLYFTGGLTYNIHARGVLLKSKLLQDCVFDASASMLSPVTNTVPPNYLLALLNSHVVSFYIKKFLNNTWHEISDLRRIPVVVPTPKQLKCFDDLVGHAFQAKRLIFAGAAPADALNELVVFVRELSERLAAAAPSYLQPSAQLKLLHTAADCLAVLELAVNWEAEKLYGVEGQGPFDEF
jgi:hypothetical protein